MQSLNISGLTNKLQIIANKIPEMKHVSIFNSIVCKLNLGHTLIVSGP